MQNIKFYKVIDVFFSQEVIIEDDDGVEANKMLPTMTKKLVKTHGDDQTKIVSITGLPQPPKLKPIPILNNSSNVNKPLESMASKTYAAARAKLVPETKLKMINRSSLPTLTPQPQQKSQENTSKKIVFPSTTTITLKSNRPESSTPIISTSAINPPLRSVKIIQANSTAKPTHSQIVRIPMPQTNSTNTTASTAQTATTSASVDTPSEESEEVKTNSNELPDNWKLQLKQQHKQLQTKMGNDIVSKEVSEALSDFKKWVNFSISSRFIKFIDSFILPSQIAKGK